MLFLAMGKQGICAELSMMPNLTKVAAALACLSVVAAADAVQLGHLNVTSAAQENFEATLFVVDAANVKGNLVVKLAGEQTYDKLHLKRAPIVQGLRLTLASRSPLSLTVASSVPLNVQSLPLLVELHEGDKVSVRQYTIRAGHKGEVLPVIPAAIAMTEAKAAQEAFAKEPAKVTQSKPAPTPGIAKSVESEATPFKRMQSDLKANEREIVVEPGMTPWSLGMHFKSLYPQAAVQQVLVALAKYNPQAFPNGTVTYLRPGQTVRAPETEAVMAISLDAAKRIVNQGLTIAQVEAEPMPIAAPVHAPTQAPTHAKAEHTPQAAQKAQKVPPKSESKSESKSELTPFKDNAIDKEPTHKTATTPVLAGSGASAQTASTQEAVAHKTQPTPEQKLEQNGEGSAQQAAQQNRAALAPEKDALQDLDQNATASALPSLNDHTSTSSALPQEATPLESLESAEHEAPMAPSLDIMTEESVVSEQEGGSGWLWMVLSLLVALGAGFVYYKKALTQRQQEAFTSSLRERAQSMRKTVTRREPSVAARPQAQAAVYAAHQNAGQTVKQTVDQTDHSAEAEHRVQAAAAMSAAATATTLASQGLSLSESAPVSAATTINPTDTCPALDTQAQVSPAEQSLGKDESRMAQEGVYPTREKGEETLAQPSEPAPTGNVFDLAGAVMAQQEAQQDNASPLAPESMMDELQMARSFIQVGSDDQARELLYQVLDQGTQAEQNAAREMLAALSR